MTTATTTGPETSQRDELKTARVDQGIVAAVYSSAIASQSIMVSGEEYLPLGGYSGEAPSPSLAAIEHLVRTGHVSRFSIPFQPTSRDPRFVWVTEHCTFDGYEDVGAVSSGSTTAFHRAEGIPTPTPRFRPAALRAAPGLRKST